MLTRAVCQRSHAFLHGLILRREALDARHCLVALLFAVDQVIVGGVANRAERRWVNLRVYECFIVYGVPVIGREWAIGIPTHGPNPASLVVARHPAVSVDRKTLLVRDHRVSGKQKLRQPPVVGVFLRISAHSNEKPVASLLDGELGRLIEKMVLGPEISAVLDLLNVRRCSPKCIDTGMQEIGMARVYPAFHRLEIVRLLEALGNISMGFRYPRPLQFRQLGNTLSWPHVSPDDSAILARRVRGRADSVMEGIFRWLVGHVDASAVDIKFPAVIDASKTTLFVATPEEARPPVSTELIQQTGPAGRVTKGDQIFTEQANPHRPAIGRRKFGHK